MTNEEDNQTVCRATQLRWFGADFLGYVQKHYPQFLEQNEN